VPGEAGSLTTNLVTGRDLGDLPGHTAGRIEELDQLLGAVGQVEHAAFTLTHRLDREGTRMLTEGLRSRPDPTPLIGVT